MPRTTIKDRLSGRVTHGSAPGAKPYLSREEEKELVDFLVTCSKIGYAKSRKEVLALVGSILKEGTWISHFLMVGGFVSLVGGLI